MKKTVLWLILAITMVAQAANDPAVTEPKELKPLSYQPRAAHLAATILGHHHYRTPVLDDALSANIFDEYLKVLDPERVFFTQKDIDRWDDARTKLDDAIIDEDLTIPFAIFNRYTQRVTEHYNRARTLLKSGFDFTRKENYDYLREKAPWPASEAEVQELWRKRVKNDWLQLKLTGKDDQTIATTLDKRYENFLKRMARSKSEDAFQTFMNAYTMAVDPHTNYLGPRASEDFDISMKLSLVGIGALLEEKDDYATIKELVPGGPAALNSKLKPGDRILGIAQGEKGALVDVVGWRLDDTVALIRGTADTVVRLDILPADSGLDGKHVQISLIRKKIALEEQAAKKKIITVDDAGKAKHIGIISLPGFYQDFEARQRGEKDYRSATRDVAKILQELKQEKVDGVVVDLRNNGGGSLTEAVELTGLFIDTGPVVIQRDSRGNTNVSRDNNPGTAWDGPLGVLINRSSASASEIFAAAIQDYRRGLIIGETSFGKGTVQTMLNLDEASQTKGPKLGELKLTIAQFFRINGSTTQLRGVTPDIALPSLSDTSRFGESSYTNALPWVRIRPVNYGPLADLSEVLPLLQTHHDSRISSDKDFRYLQEDIAELNALRNKHSLSLNEKERRAERESREARLKARRANGASGSDDRLSEEEDPENSAEKTKAQKNAKDVLLDEAAHIISDEVELLHSRSDLAARALPDVSGVPR
ncbi:MAG TPA: carboxy terminal-processing peptidase [Rhodocyclaceae bacterium]|jgi:carboxyl-terminal processing protease